MKRIQGHPGANRDGFTLIEIIVTIVISAVLATILAQVVSSQTDRSYAPLVTVNENLALRAVMENITAEYRQRAQMGAVNLYSFAADIHAGNYWKDTITGSTTITAELGCFPMNDFEAEATSPYCSETDAVLEVTLTVQGAAGQQVTALFTQR